MSTLSKAIHMIEILSLRNIVSVDELSRSLELSPRAVQRLKETLLNTGFNIKTIMGPQGGYVLESRSTLFNLDFSHDELKLIRQGLKYLVETQTINPTREFPLAIAKLANQIDGFGVETVSSFQTVKLNVDPIAYQKHIAELEKAISDETTIKMVYKKSHKEENTYIFEPYEMVIVNNFWYVMGFDERSRYLSLKINRIDTIEILDKKFRRDESIMENSINKFGYRIKPVRIVCHVRDGDYISEYIWGKNQAIEWYEDGSFTLDVEFQNEAAAKDFILKNGSKIIVQEPAYLITWLKEETLKILAQYT